MPKDDGFSSYGCDRDPAHDGNQAYLKDSAPQVSDWHKIQRVRADGTIIERWLCAACNKEYRAIFNKFMETANGQEA